MFISAGHSNTDPGAVSFGRREADIVCDFRNLVAFYLMRKSIPHMLDGIGVENLPLSRAAQLARQHNLAVEFHCDSIKEPRFDKNGKMLPRASGCHVIAAPKDNAIAAKISAAIATTLMITNRGVKPENSGQHSRLAFVQAGGMIVELFFLSNREDLQKYDDKKWLVARAISEILIAEQERRPCSRC